MKLQCGDLWTKGQHLEDQILSIELVELVLWEANRLCWKGLCHSHFQKCRDQCQDQCQDTQDHEKTPSQRPMGGGGGAELKDKCQGQCQDAHGGVGPESERSDADLDAPSVWKVSLLMWGSSIRSTAASVPGPGA